MQMTMTDDRWRWQMTDDRWLMYDVWCMMYGTYDSRFTTYDFMADVGCMIWRTCVSRFTTYVWNVWWLMYDLKFSCRWAGGWKWKARSVARTCNVQPQPKLHNALRLKAPIFSLPLKHRRIRNSFPLSVLYRASVAIIFLCGITQSLKQDRTCTQLAVYSYLHAPNKKVHE